MLTRSRAAHSGPNAWARTLRLPIVNRMPGSRNDRAVAGSGIAAPVRCGQERRTKVLSPGRRRSPTEEERHVLPAARSGRAHGDGQPSWTCEFRPATLSFQNRLGRTEAAPPVRRLLRHAAGHAALVEDRAPGVERRVGKRGGRHRGPCRTHRSLAVSQPAGAPGRRGRRSPASSRLATS